MTSEADRRNVGLPSAQALDDTLAQKARLHWQRQKQMSERAANMRGDACLTCARIKQKRGMRVGTFARVDERFVLSGGRSSVRLILTFSALRLGRSGADRRRISFIPLSWRWSAELCHRASFDAEKKKSPRSLRRHASRAS